MCTPLLPKMHTPRPFVKRCYGRKWKKLCGNRFRSTAEPYIVKKYRKSLANQGLCKKKLDTNQDTHCIKIGVQLWQGSKDSNSGHAVLETAALPTELHPYEESPFPETYSSVSYSFWKSKSFFQKSQNFCVMLQEMWKRTGRKGQQQPKTALENSQRVHSFSFCRAVWAKPILPFPPLF